MTTCPRELVNNGLHQHTAGDHTLREHLLDEHKLGDAMKR